MVEMNMKSVVNLKLIITAESTPVCMHIHGVISDGHIPTSHVSNTVGDIPVGVHRRCDRLPSEVPLPTELCDEEHKALSRLLAK